MITLDDSPFNRSLFADCDLHAVTTACGASNRRTAPGKRFGELVITPR